MLELRGQKARPDPRPADPDRGGLVYFRDFAQRRGKSTGVISATRGNHGQSVGFAAHQYAIPDTIVVPQGNSAEKNAAVRALGVELIEHGEDFQAAREAESKRTVLGQVLPFAFFLIDVSQEALDDVRKAEGMTEGFGMRSA